MFKQLNVGSRPCLAGRGGYKSNMQERAMRRYSFYFVILGIHSLLAPAWAQEQTPSPAPTATARDYVEQGTDSGAKGDLDAAIAAFDQALSIDPKYAPAYFFRGKAHALQNKPDDAIADYSKVIQYDPNNKEAYFQRGSLRGQEGDFDEAISDFSAVIKLDPKNAPAYFQLGHAKYFKGDLDGAADDLNQSLTLEPGFSIGYFIRGLLRHAQQHQALAASDFQKSASLGFPNAAFWIWITEMENDQHGVAQTDLQYALSKPESFKPDDWPSQIGNFLLNNITQDQLMAKAKTKSATETEGRLCAAWFYAGMLKQISGDTKGARDCFAHAIATGSKGSEEFVEANRELTALPQP